MDESIAEHRAARFAKIKEQDLVDKVIAIDFRNATPDTAKTILWLNAQPGVAVIQPTEILGEPNPRCFTAIVERQGYETMARVYEHLVRHVEPSDARRYKLKFQHIPAWVDNDDVITYGLGVAVLYATSRQYSPASEITAFQKDLTDTLAALEKEDDTDNPRRTDSTPPAE